MHLSRRRGGKLCASVAMGLIAAHYSKNLTDCARLDKISCRNFNGPAINEHIPVGRAVPASRTTCWCTLAVLRRVDRALEGGEAGADHGEITKRTAGVVDGVVLRDDELRERVVAREHVDALLHVVVEHERVEALRMLIRDPVS